MKKFLSISILSLVILNACIYDPPAKGQDVFIENQTNDYIYAIDSLPKSGELQFYDTSLVNNGTFIIAKPNYIPAYRNWHYFFYDSRYKKMKEDSIDKIVFYFIQKQDQNKSVQEIVENQLYKFISIDIDEIRENSINHIFYNGDSIKLTHIFDWETIKKPK